MKLLAFIPTKIPLNPCHNYISPGGQDQQLPLLGDFSVPVSPRSFSRDYFSLQRVFEEAG
jgi:hypothetical protein